MKLKIKVTKKILKESMMCGTSVMGTPQFKPVSESCAVALAVRDLFPEARIGRTFVQVGEGSFMMPLNATNYIIRFDELWYEPARRLNLPEIEFEVDVPEAVINKIDIAEATEIIKNSETLELV